MTTYALFRRLLGYSLRYWPGFAVATLGMIVTASTETAFPALMKVLMDNGFQAYADFSIWWVPIIILSLFTARGFATFLAHYCMEWVANNTLRDVRAAMFEKMLTLPSSSYDSKSAGQLIARMINEAQQVLLAATNVVTVIVRDSLILLGLVGWLVWINWQLALIVLGLVPFLAAINRSFSSRMRRVSKNYMASVGEMTRVVEEAITGNRVIKAYGGETYESKRFSTVNLDFRRQSMRYAIAAGLQTPISQLIAAVGVSVVVTIALFQTRAGEATAGDFVSFITAMLLMFSPLKHLAEINANFQRGLAAAEGVFALLDEDSEKDLGKRVISNSRGNLEFQNVIFAYPTRDTPALKNINLKIQAGETVALVGPSGGGKSTLISLVPRFYDIQEGRLLLDGIDIRELTLTSLRRQIALVSQDIVLFNDSIARNICYGRDDVSKDVIEHAVNAADLGDFIRSLPFGLSTVVGDRGVRVSGGQRQRIAIARAIVKNAPILILDEATSALDTQSEASVQHAIDNLREGRTTLVVAHRLSTVVSADCIVVVDAGRIIQSGTHIDLMREEGLYKTLYASLKE